MHKILPMLLTLACLLGLAGCSGEQNKHNNLSEKTAQISGIPQEAGLVYSYQATDNVHGEGITTDAWALADDIGFFVFEFSCQNGSIQEMALHQVGKSVLPIGDIREDGVYITDLVIEALGDYTLYFGKADYFEGTINIYFVPGIGYSLAD